MAIDNYLIIGVNPANNEMNVPTNTEITINFSKDMDQSTLTSSNIILKAVNGDIVLIDVIYYSLTRSLKIIPSSADLGVDSGLQPNTSYEINIIGGIGGIKTITNDYMSATRNFDFTTSYLEDINAPGNVTVAVDNGFPIVQWTPPTNYTGATSITYEVNISTSNLSTTPPVWPAPEDVGIVNKTSASTFSVPLKLDEGIYYAYVRANDGNTTTDWTQAQFYVESQTVSQPSQGPTVSYNLDIVETYPKDGTADIMPEQIIILFSDNLDLSTANPDSIYIIPKVKSGALTRIDYMTEYAPSKAISAPISVVTGQANVITLTPDPGSIVDDTKYTVVVRENVKSAGGASLGIASTFTFISTYSRLYGDVDMVRKDIGNTVDGLTDAIIYNFMSDNSDQAYQLASGTSNFLATDYANGAAPYSIHQYVRYRTSYDLLLNAQLHSSGGGGGFTSSVTLGDLNVKKTADASSNISGILSDLQERVKYYLDLLQGHHNRGYAKPSVVSRGENIEAYPSFLTRADFHDLGS